jgi:hypothetical protein
MGGIFEIRLKQSIDSKNPLGPGLWGFLFAIPTHPTNAATAHFYTTFACLCRIGFAQANA